MASQNDGESGSNLYRISPENLASSSTAALTEPKPDEDTRCGFGSWKPEWIQKLAEPKVFLVFYCAAGFMEGAVYTYFISCMSTMEKRFAYNTKKSGFLMTADEIAPVVFGVLVGYFGGMAHRPKILTFGMVIGAVSCFVMAAPYFMYGSRRFDESSGQRRAGVTYSPNAEFCESGSSRAEDPCETSVALPVITVFFIGKFLKGVSTVIFYTIGTSYMDDNIKKSNSPIYLSAVFAIRLLGPAVGFLLSSVCLHFYEDPFYDPGYGTTDPRWIGAWWLGYVILGSLIIITSLPIILFPRRLPQKDVPPSSLPRRYREIPKSLYDQLKGFGKAVKRLGTNPILMCHYVGDVLKLNGITGYFLMLPKYMEMQFRQSASKASLWSGPASVVGMQIGILLGGIVIQRFRPRPRVLTGGIALVELFTVVAYIACIFLICPVDNMTGTTIADNSLFDLKNECNADCMCTTKIYTPICGPDGKSTYFSPCYAGCSNYSQTQEKAMFTNCKCVHSADGQFIHGDATDSYCGTQCQWLITFVVILTAGKLVSSLARVGNLLIYLRCVAPKDKSVALGALSAITSLLAFIPCPLIYGALTDASCLVWEKSCGKSGNCWIYDTDKLRYLLHSVSAAFVLAGWLTDMVVWYMSPRLYNFYEEEETKEVIIINVFEVNDIKGNV